MEQLCREVGEGRNRNSGGRTHLSKSESSAHLGERQRGQGWRLHVEKWTGESRRLGSEDLLTLVNPDISIFSISQFSHLTAPLVSIPGFLRKVLMSRRQTPRSGKGGSFPIRRWSSELCTAAWRTRCTRAGAGEAPSATGRRCRFRGRKVGRASEFPSD